MKKFRMAALDEQNSLCARQMEQCNSNLLETKAFDYIGKTMVERKLQQQDSQLDSVKEHIEKT